MLNELKLNNLEESKKINHYLEKDEEGRQLFRSESDKYEIPGLFNYRETLMLVLCFLLLLISMLLSKKEIFFSF